MVRRAGIAGPLRGGGEVLLPESRRGRIKPSDRAELGEPGAFIFKPNWHEPGERTLLGKSYAQGGVEQGRAALDDLARHPATAHHIATKLARHFVADDPPPDFVETLAGKFRDSDGDLGLLAAALVSDDRAWTIMPGKIRNPLEFVVGAVRATGMTPQDPGPYLQALRLLGMPLWQPSGPNGFSDSSDAWASPEGMKMRLALASSMGQRMGARPSRLTSSGLLSATRPPWRRGKQSSGPNRANRRLRSCSWLQNSSGGDDDWPRQDTPIQTGSGVEHASVNSSFGAERMAIGECSAGRKKPARERGRWNDGTVSTFDATYYDVVPNERLGYAYEMRQDGAASSNA